MRYLRSVVPAFLAASAPLVLATAALAATPPSTMEPSQGPPGAQVHVRMVDTDPHTVKGDLVMWPISPEVSVCGPTHPYQLGAVTWDGTIGTADFLVPDVPPGDYQVAEPLGGGIACRLVGTFTVTDLPDTAMTTPADRAPTPLAAFALAALSAVALLALIPRFRKRW